MAGRIAIAVAAASLVGCASNRDYVKIDPVHFVPVVGKGGPRCQGWCPTTSDQATKFRVEVGDATFRRITNEAKAKGHDGDAAFLDFAKSEVQARGFCAEATLAPANSRQPISSVEGWSVFWTDVSCSKVPTPRGKEQP
jgi:hypothetical protein